MARILLQDVCLTYRVRTHNHTTLKDYVLGCIGRPHGNPMVEVNALRRIDLNLKDGDRLGILGDNGAGKSTLLKLIAGIYPPTSGVCMRDGKVSSLFDLVAGFEPDATGWENIYLRGYLQGQSPADIRRKAADIATFCGLGDHLDLPVRYYSSGMSVRLAFAIATAVDPEILVIDEVLAAGDAAFQRQALSRVEAMMRDAKIVALASHSLDALRQFCTQAIWLEHGSIRMSGACDEVVVAYEQYTNSIFERAA